MGQAARERAGAFIDWQGFGVAPAAVEAFRAVARERAAGLAAAYARLWRKVTGRVGKPPWAAPWPMAWTAPLPWGAAGGLAIAGLGRLDPRLGRRARALWLRRRVRRLPGPSALCASLTQASAAGPLAQVAYDGSLEAAVTLAHELGHAALTTDGWFGPSLPWPPRAAAEAGAFLAEHAFRAGLARRDARRAIARSAEDALSLLVRHPARDALEQAAAAGEEPKAAWAAAAQAYAPAHAWAEAPAPLTPRALQTPGATLVYAQAHAVALLVFARLEADRAARRGFAEWVDLGPCATLEALAALADLQLAGRAPYHRAYDLAEAALNAAAQRELT